MGGTRGSLVHFLGLLGAMRLVSSQELKDEKLIGISPVCRIALLLASHDRGKLRLGAAGGVRTMPFNREDRARVYQTRTCK